MRGELFYVISNHSCLNNLKWYESHCKIKITLYWFSLHWMVFLVHQWYCRALKLPCTHWVWISPWHCSLHLYSFTSSCASLLFTGGGHNFCIWCRYRIFWSILLFFFLLYLILLACMDSSVLESWFYSSQYLTRCFGINGGERTLLREAFLGRSSLCALQWMLCEIDVTGLSCF